MKIAIVSDANGKWFVRRIRLTEHDLTQDEKVYRCDKHLGGPFSTLDDACAAAGKIASPSGSVVSTL